MKSETTITARDLPPRHFTAEDRKALGYERINGAWHKDGRPLCSRPNDGYMQAAGGRLVRSPAPPICGMLASVRIVKSGRYYCAYHAPAKGVREEVEPRNGP